MKILVATSGKGGLEDMVSPMFGRCPTFTIVTVDGKEIKDVKTLPNQYAGGMSGVGIQVAQFAANEKVNTVMAGSFGPNATSVLAQAGIEMVQIAGIKVEGAIKKYLSKELPSAANPTAMQPPLYGLGRGRGGRRWGRGHKRGDEKEKKVKR